MPAPQREAGTPPRDPTASTVSSSRAAQGLARVREIDLGLGTVSRPGGLTDEPDPSTDAARLWAVVRVHHRPVGVLECDLPEEQTRTLTPALLAAVDGALGPEVRRDAERARARALPQQQEVATLTVVVCTRDKPDGVRRLLASLVAQTDRRFRVLVCDNAPTSDALVHVVAEVGRLLEVTRVVEPAPGLSRARNTALAAVSTELVAWLDDDETVDQHWVAALLTAFADRGVDAVSGIVLPRELDTQARVWFEQFGGHSKGRGFTPATLWAGAGQQSPLYPLPAFGVGANMAFRTAALRGLSRRGRPVFDPALGAGQPSSAGEDTLALTELLLAGGTIRYEPALLTWHSHREDLAGLEKQFEGYGRGLTAFYTALLLRRPLLLLSLVRLVPQALVDSRSGGRVLAGVPDDFPPSVLAARRRGLLAGPWSYLQARRAVARS